MRHDVVLRLFAMMLFSLALTGCIHYEHKSAEGKPTGQVATIQQFDKHLTIVKIDNDQTLHWLSRQSEYQLGAGVHTVQVTRFISAQAKTAPLAMTVELAGGRTYGLYGNVSENRWSYDIRDVETGKSAAVSD